MKKDFVSSFLSVLAGVAIGLTITLRLWGPEWYKIVVAVFAGIFFGLLNDSPKEFVALVKVAFKKSLETISVKLPYFGKKLQEFLVKSMPSVKTAIARLLVRLGAYAVILIGYAIVFTIVGYILYRSGIFNTLFVGKKTENFTILLISMFGFICIFMTLVVSSIFSIQVDIWRDSLSEKDVNRLWKGKWSFDFVCGVHEAFVSEHFWRLIHEKCSYKEIFLGVIRTTSFVFFRGISRFVKGVVGLAFFLPIWIILIALDVILIAFFFIKCAAEFYQKAMVMVSIALGIVGGTMLASSLIGFAIGAGAVTIGYLAGRYFPKESPILITSFSELQTVKNIRKRVFRGMFAA